MIELEKGNIKIGGYVEIEVVNDDGSVETYGKKNLVTDYGMEQMLKLITGISADVIDYCAVGSGNTPADYTDTALGTPIYNRVYRGMTPQIVNIGAGTSGWKVSSKHFFSRDANWNGTWKEMGMFTGSAGANCCSRIVLSSPISKTVNNTVSIVWNYILKYSP